MIASGQTTPPPTPRYIYCVCCHHLIVNTSVLCMSAAISHQCPFYVCSHFMRNTSHPPPHQHQSTNHHHHQLLPLLDFWSKEGGLVGRLPWGGQGATSLVLNLTSPLGGGETQYITIPITTHPSPYPSTLVHTCLVCGMYSSCYKCTHDTMT